MAFRSPENDVEFLPSRRERRLSFQSSDWRGPAEQS